MRPERSAVRRGEIYWVNWNPSRGSEQSGQRPAVIVQEDPASANPRYPLTIVAAISTKGRAVRSHVPLAPSEANGLSQASYVKCEQLMTVSKERLGERIGELNSDEMGQVSEALKAILALR